MSGQVSQRASDRTPRAATTRARGSAITRRGAPSTPGQRLLALQRAIGNRAVDGLLGADSTFADPWIPPIARAATRAEGQPLPEPILSGMREQLDESLDGVRVHTDSAAERSADVLQAHAYTLGDDIVFGRGEYAPHTDAGQALLWHELEHVVAQRRSGVARVERAPKSLTVELNPAALTEDELQKEVQELHRWLPQNRTHPDFDMLNGVLQGLESEVTRRGAAPKPPAAQPVKKPLIPTVKPGDEKQSLVQAMAVIDSIRPSDVASGVFTVVIEGETKTIDQKTVDKARADARAALTDALRRVDGLAASAAGGYQAQSDVDKQHWIVSRIVKTIGRIEDPGPALFHQISLEASYAGTARTAMSAGHFSAAAAAVAEAEICATRAHKMFQAYWQDIISTGEMTITVLEYTRDASFITLGILATIATGGAAAGATTTLFGAEVGVATTANVIATAAPVVATLSETGVKVALGEKVDWASVGIDIATSLILSKFGGKMGEGFFKALAGNPAVRTAGRAAVSRVVASVLTHEAGQVFTTTVQDVYRSFRGQALTWDQFTDHLIQRLTDPKGIAVAAVLGGVTAHAEYRQGAAAPPAQPPAEQRGLPPPAPEPRQNVPVQESHVAPPPAKPTQIVGDPVRVPGPPRPVLTAGGRPVGAVPPRPPRLVDEAGLPLTGKPPRRAANLVDESGRPIRPTRARRAAAAPAPEQEQPLIVTPGAPPPATEPREILGPTGQPARGGPPGSGRILEPGGEQVLPGGRAKLDEPVVPASEWKGGVGTRGLSVEAAVIQRRYPGSQALPKNFPAFDAVEGGQITSGFFGQPRGGLRMGQRIEGGRAISIKSADLSEPGYQTAEGTYRNLSGYVRDIAEFPKTGFSLAGRGPDGQPFQVTLANPSARILHVELSGVPNEAQLAGLARLRFEAAKQDIQLTVIAPH